MTEEKEPKQQPINIYDDKYYDIVWDFILNDKHLDKVEFNRTRDCEKFKDGECGNVFTEYHAVMSCIICKHFPIRPDVPKLIEEAENG